MCSEPVGLGAKRTRTGRFEEADKAASGREWRELERPGARYHTRPGPMEATATALAADQQGLPHQPVRTGDQLVEIDARSHAGAGSVPAVPGRLITARRNELVDQIPHHAAAHVVEPDRGAHDLAPAVGHAIGDGDPRSDA